MKKGLLATLFLCICLVFIAPSNVIAVPVDLELLLLVDVSGSVDATEYALQKTGYANAFQDPTIQALISSLPGGIAVSYAEWSGSTQQIQQVGWTHVYDQDSANDFGNSILGVTRIYGGLTAPGSAINWGTGLFVNDFEGARLTMDVSGDGSQNEGANTFNAASAAFDRGIIVNGLAILGSELNLDTWYQNNIATPGGGFLVVANNFDDFGDAVYSKIFREIQPVPEPSIMLLLGAGLLGLAGLRRKFKK